MKKSLFILSSLFLLSGAPLMDALALESEQELSKKSL